MQPRFVLLLALVAAGCGRSTAPGATASSTIALTSDDRERWVVNPLHDIGTCVTGGDFPDQAAPDEVDGKMHTACDFDTPSLRGIFATAPYFHDGSAATLREVMDRLPATQTLSSDDRDALVAYVETL